MSREAFQAPSLPPQSGPTSSTATQSHITSNPGANTSSYNTFAAPSASFEDASRTVGYLCGDCDAKVQLKRGDPIRCKECGYRVLYKERTNRMIQFEAR